MCVAASASASLPGYRLDAAEEREEELAAAREASRRLMTELNKARSRGHPEAGVLG
jgi:hypothetical protein